MDWSDSWRGAFRIELRAQAIGLAWRGWPVMPGTYPASSGWVGGTTPQADGPSPVHEDWAAKIGAPADEVAEWWNGDDAYSLLVATGTTLDVIEVGDEIGRRTAAVLRSNGQPVPIAATPAGRWLFLVASGQELPAELAGRDDVVLHGKGSWIPLPPTAYLHGIVHWRVRPEVCGWTLPNPAVVTDAMVAAVSGYLPAGLTMVNTVAQHADAPLVGVDGARI